MSRFGAVGLVALLVGCLNAEPDVANRPAVTFVLPVDGLTEGSDSASVVLVEIGSFACPYCKMFQDSLLTVLRERLIGSGEMRFRFMSFDSMPALTRLTAWGRCTAEHLGADSVMRLAFGAVFSRDSLAPARLMSSGADERCMTRELADVGEEARIAKRIGVRRVPTFIIGVQDGQRVTGWVVEGMRERVLMHSIDSVRSLVQLSAGAS